MAHFETYIIQSWLINYFAILEYWEKLFGLKSLDKTNFG